MDAAVRINNMGLRSPLILLTIALLYCMVCLTISRYTYTIAAHGNYLSEKGLVKKAISDKWLLKALAYLPVKIIPFLGDIDRQKIHYYLGRTYFNQAKAFKDTAQSQYIELLQKAQIHYKLSVKFDPENIASAKRLAQTMFALEKSIGGDYNALPYFERLHELGPNIIKNQYEIARYYHFKGMEDRVFQKTAHLAAIHPSAYRKLKKEAFYSSGLNPAIWIGLEKASKKMDFGQKQAYFSMGTFLKDEKNISGAVKYYRKGMEIRPYENSERNYLFLGRLFLEMRQFEQAFTQFKTAVIKTGKPENCIKQIYHYFKKDLLFEEFLVFSRMIEEKAGNIQTFGIFIARARIEMGLYNLARARLIRMNSEKQNPEAFYLLALIAKKEKDWDAMELNSQKASILDPENCHYYKLFAKSLKMQGKHTQAKFNRDKATQCFKSKKK